MQHEGPDRVPVGNVNSVAILACKTKKEVIAEVSE